MADSIVRLRVDSQEYDNKLKRAAEGLNRYIEGCRKAGGTLEHVDDGVKEFTKELGKMGTVAGGTKGKLGEMTKAFTDLTMQFNQMSEAEKRGQFGKALSTGLDELKQRIISTKKELADINSSLSGGATGGGGLFGGGKLSGMLQVFGGNVMTKIAGMGLGLAGELKDMVAQGIELARAGEGVRIAFERLGRGDLLDGLRQATHGTVTDLELMKAAVKFNDFKLPLEELGTMLAFAQQKAKDTGQSVSYLVDSIVNGLGRKSKLILDNLGISATELDERMKETGDMTKAVGEIIREQMSKAGDYVETAADRATKANVELENAMTRLGETFQPLTDAANSMWTDIKVGALDLLNSAVKPLIKALQEAGTLGQSARSSAGYNNLGGDNKVDRMIKRLGDGKSAGAYSIYQRQLGEFDKYINNKKFQIASFGNDKSGVAQSNITRLQTELDGAIAMRAEYVRRAQELHNKPIDNNTPVPVEIKNPTGGSTINSTGKIAFDINRAGQAGINGVDTMPSVWGMLDEKGRKQLIGTGAKAFDLGKDITEKDLKKLLGKGTKEEKKDDKMMDNVTKLTSGVTGIFSGIEQMGIEIPDGMKQALNAINGLMSIAQSILVVVEAIKGLEAVGLIKLAGGGIVPHAAGGYMIGGNSYSGDNIYAGGAWVNSGELVLNRAQQSTLASQLQGQDKQMHVVGEVQGEKIILVANRTFRRKGQGEIVTW